MGEQVTGSEGGTGSEQRTDSEQATGTEEDTDSELTTDSEQAIASEKGTDNDRGADKRHDTDLGLGTIGQIVVTVRDVERATRFYRDALGLPFLFDAPGMAFFDCGGVRLMLSLPEGTEHDTMASVLYFKIDDITRAHGVLAGREVNFVGDPHVVHRTDDYELWMAFFKDSEDNLMALMSEVAGGKPVSSSIRRTSP